MQAKPGMYECSTGVDDDDGRIAERSAHRSGGPELQSRTGASAHAKDHALWESDFSGLVRDLTHLTPAL